MTLPPLSSFCWRLARLGGVGGIQYRTRTCGGKRRFQFAVSSVRRAGKQDLTRRSYPSGFVTASDRTLAMFFLYLALLIFFIVRAVIYSRRGNLLGTIGCSLAVLLFAFAIYVDFQTFDPAA